MAAKKYPKVIVDDDKLDEDRSDYLTTFWDGFISIRRGASFYVDPYSPH